MEIGLQENVNLMNNRIRNYIRFKIGSKLKAVEQLYNKMYNPFYNWEIGNLPSTKIKGVLIYFFDNNETDPMVIKLGDDTIKEYALLLHIFRDLSRGKHPEKLSIGEWSDIKEAYKMELKNEREFTYKNTFSDDYRHKSIKDENETFDVIIEDVKSILDDVYQGNWHVDIRQNTKGIFDHRIIIMNLSLTEEKRESILNKSINILEDYFLNNYGKNEFKINENKGELFIDGLFLYDFSE